ncbi:helix-turn-helix domain-containing protein [Weissella viridescens]|uniref:helix-turn-helix domain-containing protein n=1 Tax=Weissella viridescens TaxID=1629 RepID=UPI003AF294C8
MSFGKVIKNYRTENGLSQVDLAKRGGDKLQQTDISRLERQFTSKPAPEKLSALAKAMNISVDKLIELATNEVG